MWAIISSLTKISSLTEAYTQFLSAGCQEQGGNPFQGDILF